MYIDTTNGLTHVTAHNGHVLVNGGKIVNEIWLTQGESAHDWNEVSDLVLLTPQEQQQRLDELEQTNAELENQKAELENQVTDYENKWNDKEALQARVDELGKLVPEEQPSGDYLNPIRYVDGMAVEEGKWYAVDDPDNPTEPFIWEAKKSGVPLNGQDTEYFDIV